MVFRARTGPGRLLLHIVMQLAEASPSPLQCEGSPQHGESYTVCLLPLAGRMNKGTHTATHLHCSSTQECLEQLASLKQQQQQQPVPWAQPCQQPIVLTAQHAASHEGQACSQHLQCQHQGQSTQQQARTSVDDPQNPRPSAGSTMDTCSHNGCCSSRSSHCQQPCSQLPPVGLLMPAGTAVSTRAETAYNCATKVPSVQQLTC